MEHKPEAILAAAVEVFRHYGVGASTAKVAEAAGVSNGTLFNYFPTKQDLIDQLYLSIKRDMIDSVGPIDDRQPLPEQLRSIWQRWFRWARVNRGAHEVMNLLLQSGMASAAAQDEGARLFEPVVAVMEAGGQSDLFVDLPMSYLSSIMQLHLDQVVVHELGDEQVSVAFDMLWKAITRPHD